MNLWSRPRIPIFSFSSFFFFFLFHKTSNRFSKNWCSSLAITGFPDTPTGRRWSFSPVSPEIVSSGSSSLSYHAGENGLWIWGGFGFGGGGVATLINPWPWDWPWGVGWLAGGGGLPREEGVWGLGTATLRGPVTDRFVAINGGLCASDRLSDRREIPPSESREPSDIRSGSWCCTWGWWSRPSCGCNLGGGSPRGSGNLELESIAAFRLLFPSVRTILRPRFFALFVNTVM